MKTYTFHVSGTHCASCKILIEDILDEQDFVSSVRVDLKKETVEIETDSEKSIENLAYILTNKVKKNGYKISVEKEEKMGSDNVIWKAIPIGLLFLIFFFLLQKSGILNFGIGSVTTPSTSFIIGLIASVSSCLAIVGGLILSLSATVSEDEDSKIDKKNFTLFHIGRLLGFAVLGGLLGLLGNAIGINFIFTAILGLLASVVMIYLGFNLLGVFEKSKITLPAGIFKFFRKIEHKTFAPLLLGVGTFFLPCGFTQAMQIVALSSGGFLSGALIMFAFALGTLPVLLFLSFGSASFAKSKNAPLFFKSAGIIVIGLGIFSLLSLFAGLGFIKPLFNI